MNQIRSDSQMAVDRMRHKNSELISMVKHFEDNDKELEDVKSGLSIEKDRAAEAERQVSIMAIRARRQEQSRIKAQEKLKRERSKVRQHLELSSRLKLLEYQAKQA